MRKIQSVLCAAVLALSLSSTVLAGNIHGVKSSAYGDIHGVTSWDTITDVLLRFFGNIHG